MSKPISLWDKQENFQYNRLLQGTLETVVMMLKEVVDEKTIRLLKTLELWLKTLGNMHWNDMDESKKTDGIDK